MTTTTCNCCKEELPVHAPVVVDAIGEVCLECGQDLEEARLSLEANGMAGVYRGPCPDNDLQP